MRTLVGVPKVEVTEIAATMVDQVVNSFEKDMLLNEDLVRIGSEVLQRQETYMLRNVVDKYEANY